MFEEILEITPSGGIYCLIPPRSFQQRQEIDCAHLVSFPVAELIDDIKKQDYTAETGFVSERAALRWALSRACGSTIACMLAHDARFEGWRISMEPDGDYPHIEPRDKCLFIPFHAESLSHLSRLPDSRMAFLFDLIKGLRLIWQDAQIDFDESDLSAEELVKSRRVAEADADMVAILSAYQMRENTRHDLWRYVLSGDLHEIAITMSECLDYDSSDDGVMEALGFVFPDWFLDDARLNRVDHETLTLLDKGWGRGQESLEFDDILKFSLLPDGFSYLEYVAADILTDAFYARVSNPVNAAHLKQIVQESQIALIEGIGFRDMDLARKFFPQNSFEAIV